MILKTAAVEDFDSVYDALEASFVPEERRDREDARRLMIDGAYTLLHVVNDGERVGFFTVWELDGFAFVEHFVTLPFSLDAVMGIAVSVLICLAALGILNEAKDAILGEAPADEMIERINEIVSHYPDALGIHDMIVHHYGPGRTYASLHVEVDGKKNVYESHDMIDNIEVELRQNGIEATVHMDPIETDNEKVMKMREKILSVVQSVDASLRIHDFRFVEGGTHSNMIFDLVVPFDLFPDEKELKKLISAEISRHYPNYYAVMKIDRA
jgi:divalent metal cation (Fe/Co/Zn/Cd) transporter